jgi:hypothetical protein
MDDRRIRELTEQVLAHLRGAGPGGPTEAQDLASRVDALEHSVGRLEGSSPAVTTTVVVAHAHPSLHVLNVPGGSDRCVLEPDKPCVKSQACRVLGH